MASSRAYEQLIPQFLLDAEVTPHCAEADPDAFFPVDDFDSPSVNARTAPHYANERAAKAVCSQCPLKIECLVYALKTGQQGIWGGTTENDRRQLRRRRNSLPLSVTTSKLR